MYIFSLDLGRVGSRSVERKKIGSLPLILASYYLNYRISTSPGPGSTPASSAAQPSTPVTACTATCPDFTGIQNRPFCVTDA